MINEECVITNVKLRGLSFLIPHFTLVIICLFILLSCSRPVNNFENIDESLNETSGLVTWSGAWPMAILQPGGYPIWFQLTENGPLHIGSIEEAADQNPLIPWPYALHIIYLTETDDSVVMAVNRDGFLKLEPHKNADNSRSSDIALFRFSGGDYWSEFTVGGFVLYEDNPAALLYRDDHFLNDAVISAYMLSRTWSFNMNSNILFPIDIPVLKLFPKDEGWVIDTLRQGADGYFYGRAEKKGQRELRMFRTRDLSLASGVTNISSDVFHASSPRETDFSRYPWLPILPEGFSYTGIAQIAGSFFVSWEEQTDYSIGAAGFMLIKP